jgi:hypothetical protein
VAPDSPDFNFVTATEIEEKTAPEEKVILTRQSHVKISQRLQVPELSGEIERAVWQVNRALSKDSQESEKSAGKPQARNAPSKAPAPGLRSRDKRQ